MDFIDKTFSQTMNKILNLKEKNEVFFFLVGGGGTSLVLQQNYKTDFKGKNMSTT